MILIWIWIWIQVSNSTLLRSQSFWETIIDLYYGIVDFRSIIFWRNQIVSLIEIKQKKSNKIDHSSFLVHVSEDDTDVLYGIDRSNDALSIPI